MPITYSSQYNVVYVDYVPGDTKGDSFANPYTFSDVADFLESIGIFVTRAGSSYYFKTPIKIQGLETYFSTNDEKIEWELADTSQNSIILNLDYCNVQSVRSTFKAPRLNDPISHRLDINLYSGEFVNSHFLNIRTITIRNVTISYSVFSNIVWLQTYEGFNVDNTTFINCRLFPHMDFQSSFNLKFYIGQLLLGYGKTSVNMNYIEVDQPYTIRLSHLGSSEVFFNLVDSKVETSNVEIFITRANQIVYFQLKSTFNVLLDTTVDSIKILDKDGNEVYEGVECNNEEVIYFNWYYRTNADSEIDEETPEADKTREPFTLIAENPGYQTLEIPNITVTPGEPTIIRGAMVKNVPINENKVFSMSKLEISENNNKFETESTASKPFNTISTVCKV